MMYKVEAIIREEKLEDIKEALHEIDVNGVTAYQVMGFGAQRGYKTVVRGQEIAAAKNQAGNRRLFGRVERQNHPEDQRGCLYG